MKTPTPIIIYEIENGQTHIEVQLDKDTLWLNLLQIAELFERNKSVISRHLKNIFDTGELDKNATVQTEGNRSITREIEYFNLDAIISVGYRVNSKKGTQFRIWASNCGAAFWQEDAGALDGLKALLGDAVARVMDAIDAHIECRFLQVLQLDARTPRLEALEISDE
jgi:hypothetical protein